MLDLIGAVYGTSELISGIVILIAAIFVFRKDPKYDLNRLVSLALFFFSIMLVSEGSIYLLQSNDMVINNLIRDITEISGIIAASFILLAGIEVHRGVEWRKLEIIVPIFIIALLSIVCVSLHHVYIQVIDGANFYYYEGEFIWVPIVVSIIPIIELIVSLVFFNSLWLQIKNDNPQLAKKLLFLQICFVLIIGSAGFLVVVLTVAIPAGIAPNLFVVLFGQVGYLLSSLFAFLAFK